MDGKILSITRAVPQETTLPDGTYVGKWGGYTIRVNHNGNEYDMKTEEGVRGIGIGVVVTITNGVASFVCTKN